MTKLTIKTDRELAIMRECGRRLAEVKEKVKERVRVGTSAFEIERYTNDLISKSGGEASFKMVQGYSWATCVNVNDGVVHGIPTKEVVFNKNDIVSVDLGLYNDGFHTDTAFSLLLGEDKKRRAFLEAGQRALNMALEAAKVGNKIGDISYAIEKNIREAGYEPIRALTGHGVGRALHEDPRIPCFVSGSADEKVTIRKGMVIAIEVMYSEGDGDLVLSSDGWTISTKDGKIAALFEETVAFSRRGRIVLTRK